MRGECRRNRFHWHVFILCPIYVWCSMRTHFHRSVILGFSFIVNLMNEFMISIARQTATIHSYYGLCNVHRLKCDAGAAKGGCAVWCECMRCGLRWFNHRPPDFNFVHFLHHLQITEWTQASACWWLRRKFQIRTSSSIYFLCIGWAVLSAAADKSLIRCVVYYCLCFARKSIAFGELQWKKKTK